MTGVKHIYARLVTLVVVGTLVGCGGVATAPSNALLPAISKVQWVGAPIASTKCPSDKGVSVKPCAVKLTAGEPDVKVTTNGPKGGAFTINDTGCATRLVATIKGKRDIYTVKAGANDRGQCVATFIDYTSTGKRLGAAKLIIVNKVDRLHK